MLAEEIRQKREALITDNRQLRARNLAQELGISEAELLAAQTGAHIVRLRNEPAEILGKLAPLGEVMALSRNEACVHERKGVYEGGSFDRHGKMTIGLFNNPDIDLRLFMDHWTFAYAVEENERHSLQFFDRSGTAVHKVYLTGKSDQAAFQDLVAHFRADEQNPAIAVEAYPAPPADAADDAVDWQAFRAAWENLGDVHNFFPMLKKFKVGREQAFRHVGADFAHRLGNGAARRVLELARDRNCEIMVFVGNRGCIQIHTGPVRKLVEHGAWFNVLDPKFNLHLDERQIAATWVTRKPTDDGIITAVEVFDGDGELIVTFFGKRKPGIPEMPLWREIVDGVCAAEPFNGDH